MEERRPQSYEQRFLAVSTKMERLFFRLAMMGFAGIVASQLILSVPELRQAISLVDSMEGQKISEDADNGVSYGGSSHEIIIRPATGQILPASAWVKVNGVPVERIRDQEIVLKVRDGDKVEIDTTLSQGIYQFEIDHNDPAITSPTPGTVIVSSESHAAVIDRVFIDKKSLAR